MNKEAFVSDMIEKGATEAFALFVWAVSNNEIPGDVIETKEFSSQEQQNAAMANMHDRGTYDPGAAGGGSGGKSESGAHSKGKAPAGKRTSVREKPVHKGLMDAFKKAAGGREAEVNPLEALQQSFEQFVGKEVGNLAIFKQNDGKLRWIITSSNAFEDREGEILSYKSLAEDCDRCDRTGDYGPLRFWHMGVPGSGVDIGTCDFNAMSGHTLVESGTFKDDFIGQKIKEHQDDYAASLGFLYPITEPDSDGVYHHVRKFERSVLRNERAANPYTAITVHKENSMATLDEKWKEFVALIGDEGKAKEYVTGLAQKEQEIVKDGVRYKAVADGVAAKKPGSPFGGPPAATAAAEPKAPAPAEGLWPEGSTEEEAGESPDEATAEGDETGASGPSIADMTIGELQEALATMLAQLILSGTKELSNRIAAMEQAGVKTKELADQRLLDLNDRLKELEGDAPQRPGFRASAAPETVARKELQQPVQYMDPLVAHALEGLPGLLGR